MGGILFPQKTAHPELVEGLTFLFDPAGRKEGQGFDKLSLSGDDVMRAG